MNQILLDRMARLISMHTASEPNKIKRLLDRYGSVDLILHAIEYARQHATSLEQACEMLYKEKNGK